MLHWTRVHTQTIRSLALVMLTLAVGTAAAATRTDKSATPAAADRIFDMPYLMRDLPNGLRVIVVPTDYPDIVTIQIPVLTGSRNEVEAGKSGFAHFFEHMMFRGTEAYPPEEYKQILKNAGADQNAYTSDDYTNYHITFTRDDLEKVIELEADRFKNLTYTEEQFRTEALAVKGEYLKNYSNPVQKLFERIRELAFTEHPYRHTTMGFLEDIEQMPDQIEYAREFFDRWYRPQNAAVILVGDVDPARAFKLVKKHWGDWERGNYQAQIPAEPAPAGAIYDHVVWEPPTQPWVAMAFRGPAFDPRTKDMPAMDLISQIYFSETSELYQRLVTREQLVDQLWSYFPDRADPNLLMIGARLLKPEHAETVHDAILDTLARARTERVDPQRLEDIKSNLRYQVAKQMDSSDSIGSLLASYVRFERTPETLNEVYRRYGELTPDDIVEYANRYFTEAARVTVSLANSEQLAGLKDATSLDRRVAALSEREAAKFELVQMPSQTAPLVDVAFLFHTGAAYDPPGKKGLAALTAAMLTDGGSKRRGIDEINQAFYPLAAGFNAQVDKEMTRLAGSVHRDKLGEWYRIASEQLLTPGWREEDFERVRRQTVNAIRTDLVGNNDEELGKEALYSLIYGPDHPYGTLNLGVTDDLEAITLDDVRDFYARHYTAANLTVGLAGGYPEKFVERLRMDLSGLPAGQPVPMVRLPKPVMPVGHNALVIEKESPAVAVSFGYPIDVRRGDPDWVALWLVRSWLGEHRSSNSHLYQRIRETRGMNYGDYAYIEYFPRGMFQFHPDANLGRRQQIFQVWVRPLRNNNDAHFATRVAIHEMNELIRNGMSQQDFDATRNYLDKYVSLLTATQSRQLGYQLDSKYYDTGDFAGYVRKELARLDLDDVNRVIRKHLQTDNLHFVFITSDAADLEQRLASNQPSPIEYNTPKPELLDEDQAIAALELSFAGGEVQRMAAEDIFTGKETEAFAASE